MKYQPPYGSSDSNAGYVNGNPQTGTRGSIPPALAFEQPMRELIEIIENVGFTPSDAALDQVWKALQVAGWIQHYAADTGAANAYACALSPVPPQYYTGMVVRIKIAHTNTGSSTINVNSLGTITIKRADGTNLQAADLPVGALATLVYDGAYFQLTNYLGVGGGGTVNNYTAQIPYSAVTGINALTGTFNPTITSLAAGNPILIKAANANTGAVTITCDAMPAKQLIWPDGSQLAANAILAGAIIFAVYDGTYFQCQTISNPVTAGEFGPPGTVFMWPKEVVPTGGLECNGASYATADYPNLFSVIGYMYGGSGASFKVPDYRGIFLRGWDHGVGNDPDRASRSDRGDGTTGDHVGTRQGDQNRQHQHTGAMSLTTTETAEGYIGGPPPAIHIQNIAVNLGAGDAFPDDMHGTRWIDGLNPNSNDPIINEVSVASLTLTTSFDGGGSESRPKNAGIMYCIAY